MKFTKLIPYLIVTSIVILAFFLRSHMFLSGDFYYLLDQARDLLLAKQVAIDHKLMLIGARSGVGGIFHGPLWIYMIVPFFLLSNGDPFLTLVPLYLLVNLSIVIVGFFVGYKLYNIKFGYLIAFLLAVSQPLIQATGYTTNAQVMPLIFLLYIYFIIRFFRGSNKDLICALFSISIGFHFQAAFAIALLPFTLVVILLRGKLPTLNYIVFSMSAFMLGVSNFIFFDLRHQFLITNSVFKLFSGNP